MKEVINKLDKLLKSGNDYFSNANESEISLKPSEDKWSKKEILGHLVDSAINNLKRFTEIQFEDKPYTIIPYKQDELVKANNYQKSNIHEIIQIWLALNQRIKTVMSHQTDRTLNYQIELYKDQFTDLRFLMTDYVDHIAHHLNQIIPNS